MDQIKDCKQLLAQFQQSKLDLREELCLRCGLCCHGKVLNGNVLTIDLGKPCQYLNGNICSIYLRRFESGECARIETAVRTCTLPRQCGYIEKNWSLLQKFYRLPALKDIIPG